MKELSLVAMIWMFLSTIAHSQVTPGVSWPDPSISIPGHVRAFITSECIEYRGWSEETVDECITREAYGYRAVVEMLMDSEFGESAAERYRRCAAGLGKLGGKFHRRKADCVSRAYCIVWRFEYSEETSIPTFRKARLELRSTPEQLKHALRSASAIVEES